MPSFSGNILKMETILDTPVSYTLPLGENKIEMNPLIGSHIKFQFNGRINCLDTGELIKKSFGGGYSYKSFITLARCDSCFISPEKCHFDKGTCREPDWGQEVCMAPHIVYLANTSDVKIGITRKTQVPTRWIDQGASYALPILEVKSRHISGLIEDAIKADIKDKTNWRKMLKNEIDPIDLELVREQIFEDYADILDDLDATDLEESVTEIHYPVEKYPEKVKTLSFDKMETIEGVLQGIKGQYLILDTGVLNIRKHQGYYLDLSY